MERRSMWKGRWILLCTLILSGLSLSVMPVQAGFKVILKNGKVIESANKPVSMEGFVRFKGIDGKFQSLPLAQVDLPATQAANQTVASENPTKRVITNEDLGSTSTDSDQNPKAETRTSLGAQPPKVTGPGQAVTQVERRLDRKGPDEASFRGKAQQIRSEIAATDARIKQINDNVANKKADGIQHVQGTYTSYMVIGDYREELRQLELKKQKLEKDFSQLEDEARAAGIPPGVLR